MDELVIHFPENSTLFDQLQKLAAELNMPADMIVLRAVNEFVGDYGLKELPADFKATMLEEVIFARGLTKRLGRITLDRFPRPQRPTPDAADSEVRGSDQGE